MFFCNFAGKNLLEFDGNHSGVYTAVAGETPAGPAVPFRRHQDGHDRRREWGLLLAGGQLLYVRDGKAGYLGDVAD